MSTNYSSSEKLAKSGANCMPSRLGEYGHAVLAGSFIGGVRYAKAITCICILAIILLCKESLACCFIQIAFGMYAVCEGGRNGR